MQFVINSLASVALRYGTVTVTVVEACIPPALPTTITVYEP